MNLVCPKCGTLLPHAQHILVKVYICECGGEIYHNSTAHGLECSKCKKKYKDSELNKSNNSHIYKTICPLQFGIKVVK